MTNTQGVIESCYNLFMELKTEVKQSDLYLYGKPLTEYAKDLCESNKRHHEEVKKALQAVDSDNMPAGILLSLQLGVSINDYIKRPGMIDSLLHRPAIFHPITPKDLQKLSGMGTEAFAKHLYNICTANGTRITPEDDEGQPYPILIERCWYAAYIYTQVTEYLDRQNAAFVPVPTSKSMLALTWINTGIADIDQHTKQGNITVGDVIFAVKNDKISTGALMLNDFFAYEAYRTKSPSLAISLRDYALKKKRSTTKQALQKLKAEVWEQMKELIQIHYSCEEKVDGKLKTFGKVSINGGTAAVANGVIRWNFNQDLFNQLLQYAPADYLAELWAADPRTSTYYFGKYIIQNRRLNEGRKDHDKIYIRTLIEKSPNLPTYDEVMNGNRDLTGRIVKKAFADLDAIDSLYYEFYTEGGNKIDDLETVNYQTFINGYIIIDYSDYPAHPDRIAEGKERAKKAKAAKEKAKLAAMAKAAVQKGQ